MTREELKKIIKYRSEWKITRQKGNYRLPSGIDLSEYIYRKICEQLRIDRLAIASDGSIQHGYLTDDLSAYEIVLGSGYKERCEYSLQEKRIRDLAFEMIH